MLTFNLAALITVPLCALGAFVLARRLGASAAGAWICGLVYGFAPPRFLRIDQAHLTAVQWIPFCLAYAHSYAVRGRKHDLRIAVAFLSLQALTSGHGAAFLAAALGGWALFTLATGGSIPVRPSLRDAGVVGPLLLVPVALLFLQYRLVQVDVGLRRELGDWTGSWASYFASPTHLDTFVLNHLGRFGTWVATDAQAYLFPGLLPLALAAAAFAGGARDTQARPHRAVRWTAALLEAGGLLLLGLAFYVLRSGASRLVFAGLTVSIREAWRLWLLIAMMALARVLLAARVPFDLTTRAVKVTRWRARLRGDMRAFYAVLFVACLLLAIEPPYGPWRFMYWWPGLSFIRVPSRFMILGTLALGVLCAYGFDALTRRRSARGRWLAATIVGLGLVAEFAVAPFDVVPPPTAIPAADRWLGSQPTPFVVAELPPMDPSIPMLHSMAHWQKTVHGYSGWVGTQTQQIASALAQVPAPDSLDALSRLGVTYLVVHTDMYEPGAWPPIEAQMAQAHDRLALVYSDANGRVYKLIGAARIATQLPSPTSTRTWHPRARVSVAAGSTSTGRNSTGD